MTTGSTAHLPPRTSESPAVHTIVARYDAELWDRVDPVPHMKEGER